MRLLALGMVLLAGLLAVLTPRPHPPGAKGPVPPPPAREETAGAPVEPPIPPVAAPLALAMPGSTATTDPQAVLPPQGPETLDLSNPLPPFTGGPDAGIAAAVVPGAFADPVAGGPGGSSFPGGRALVGGAGWGRSGGKAAVDAGVSPPSTAGGPAARQDDGPSAGATPGAGAPDGGPDGGDPGAAPGRDNDAPPPIRDQAGDPGRPGDLPRLVGDPGPSGGDAAPWQEDPLPVPEPHNLAVVATGLLFLAMRRRG